MLVGTLQGCSKSGSLLLQDSTGAFPILLTSASHTSLKHTGSVPTDDSCGGGREEPSRLSHIPFGTKIMVTDFLIVFEKTVNLSCTDAPSAGVTAYLHIVSFSTVSCSSPTPSLSCKSNCFHERPSFLVNEEEIDSSILFFRVLNKNVSVVSSTSQLEFTCQALVHSNLAALLPHSLQRASENMAHMREEVMVDAVLKVAIHFRWDAYKWFSLVSNGCVFSLSFCSSSSDSVLPSLEVLKKNLVLTVKEDMEIKLVQEGFEFTKARDVMDISSQLLLPAFPTLVCVESTASTRYIYDKSRKDYVHIKASNTISQYDSFVAEKDTFDTLTCSLIFGCTFLFEVQTYLQ